MVKTTKGGKTMNPTDAYRKELRKKEIKRNKKERKKVREVGILKKDPDTLKDQIDKLETMKAEGALDKARKHKKRQLEDTLNLVMKKRKEYEDKMKEKGEAPVMFSHLGPVRRRTTAEEEERVKNPIPEDSVYYHPTLNPSGAPPPGKPPMFKSSIGPRIPLPEDPNSSVASSSNLETENATLFPLPPPLPGGGLDSGDGSVVPTSLPLPPPPPMPPKPPMIDMHTLLPPPPPPPGPPPKDLLAARPLLPPPPTLQSAPPPPLGSTGSERLAKLDNPVTKDSTQMPTVLPPPPPPPGLPSKLGNNQPEGSSSDSDTKAPLNAQDMLKMAPPPPPLRQQSLMLGAPTGPNMQLDMLPPGISRFPPPPPGPDVHPQFSTLGVPVPPGVNLPFLPRPPFGPPPGPPPMNMMRPPLPPGPPPILPVDQLIARPFVAQKPSYVKSAASTVVKRPLAQHTPELTAMIPASVRVRRESALPKPKPKTSTTVFPLNRPIVSPLVVKKESTSSSLVPKPASIDDSYTAFLEDMKALGALDS